MKKLMSFLCLIVASHAVSYGQITFSDKQSSDQYTAIFTVAACDEESGCHGKANIQLMDKANGQLIQTLFAEDLCFQADSLPSSSIISLQKEQSPLKFADFNFDGAEDLALRNGNNGPYGSSSYEVYLYHKTLNKFVLNEDLTELTLENIGLFEVDPQRKRLLTYSKSGCCWHATAEYAYLPKKGLSKVLEVIEEADSSEEVKITTRIWVKNRWKTSVKTIKN